jgi:anti-sigma regulatory factor (Ser/Thr protein kinase)
VLVGVVCRGAARCAEGVEFVIGIGERHEAEAGGERSLALEREALLAIVAHGLRNPIQSIALSVEAVLELPLPPEEQVRGLEVVGRSAAVMERLISDLFDSARLEAGSFVVALAPLGLVSLFDEVLQVIEPQARARGSTVAREVPAAMPLVTADRTRLVEVLSNLVANTLKFTSAGGRVSIRARRLDGVLQISIADSGAGIPAAALPRVSDRYWQAEPPSRGGTGLGLRSARASWRRTAGASGWRAPSDMGRRSTARCRVRPTAIFIPNGLFPSQMVATMGLRPRLAFARSRELGQVRARRASEGRRCHSPCTPEFAHAANRRLLHGCPQAVPPRRNRLYTACSELGRVERRRFRHMGWHGGSGLPSPLLSRAVE